MARNCVEKLLELCGGGYGSVTEAARRLKTYRAQVASWQSKGYIPANWARTVELATNGEVTAAEILAEYDAIFPKVEVDHPHASVGG